MKPTLNQRHENGKTAPPSDVVNSLMIRIRTQFCGDMGGKEWGKHSHFIRRNVVLWPAKYISDRGFTLPGARYEEIMRSILIDIGQNMTTSPIRYWPGYLMRCVQEHWHHNWEIYYQEAKAYNTMTAAALASLSTLPQRPDGSIEAMADAHKVLTLQARRRPRKTQPEPTLPGF